MQHLRKHKLRSKFVLERIHRDRMGVFYAWPGERSEMGSRTGGADPRPGMGSRWIEDFGSPSKELEELEKQGSKVADRDYKIHRMLNGIAEGQTEIVGMSALPQESNIDFFGGIDFYKGCYLGQELTIRTHHTGVVRKRILPCQIYDEDHVISEDQTMPEFLEDTKVSLPPPESNMSKSSSKAKGRSTGKWLDGVGNIGLALCRLEVMTGIQLTAEPPNYDPKEQFRVQWEPDEKGLPTRQALVKPFVPPWLREKIVESLKRRERKPRKYEEEEDEVLE